MAYLTFRPRILASLDGTSKVRPPLPSQNNSRRPLRSQWTPLGPPLDCPFFGPVVHTCFITATRPLPSRTSGYGLVNVQYCRVGASTKQTLPTSPATLLGANPIQGSHFVELAVGVVATIIVRVTAIGQGGSSTACQSQCPSWLSTHSMYANQWSPFCWKSLLNQTPRMDNTPLLTPD